MDGTRYADDKTLAEISAMKKRIEELEKALKVAKGELHSVIHSTCRHQAKVAAMEALAEINKAWESEDGTKLRDM